ncbi:MAG: Peptide methionine sulfoxide reductase MsrA [Labilithrix sp.]|nr:Peptide methionine sulfoxide reductase MsrA [Labilithrix sp.]
MKLGLPTLVLSALLAAACRSSATDAKVEPSASHTRGATIESNPVRRVVGTDPGGVGPGTKLAPRPGNELAAFAAGCFWGVENNFRQVPGVVATAVGYTGGRTTSPTYETVCSHATGHAETVLVEFDPSKVSYEDLLRIFFMNHDPTTKNRQGPDVGDQYRSAVFTLSEAQATSARGAASKEAARLGKHVTTEIRPLGAFWKAEEYHQQYDEKTGTHSCPIPKGLRHEGT